MVMNMKIPHVMGKKDLCTHCHCQNGMVTMMVNVLDSTVKETYWQTFKRDILAILGNGLHIPTDNYMKGTYFILKNLLTIT